MIRASAHENNIWHAPESPKTADASFWAPLRLIECSGERRPPVIRVSVLYPNSEGKRFDEDYYVNKHLTMVADKLGPAMVRYEIDKGVGGAMPGSPAPFVAAVHMFFDSLQSFQGAFAPHAGPIMSDVPNYTDIQPTIQISEIIK
jgi:uncharacterized protein (TIGR02118 family)